ncbi:hypothetical protein I203_106673 [Kwoniella mangroviensis CBS 8507]|uniref:uncharacterized protein n=1 Tax=Kwoniella mangroviensis CBS 8507 TaxID=1296122 RepID=UPI0030518198
MQDKEDKGGLDSPAWTRLMSLSSAQERRPVCARCQKQGKECVYANAATYVAALEERIRGLEEEKVQWISQQESMQASQHVIKRARLNTDPPEIASPPSHSGRSGVSPIPDTPAILNIPPPKPSLLVAFDRSILPSRRDIHELLSRYFLYTNAAFPIFHIPTLQRQVDAVAVARFGIAVVLNALAIGSASIDKTGLSDLAVLFDKST